MMSSTMRSSALSAVFLRCVTSLLTPNFCYLQLEVMKIETAELLLEIEGIAGGDHGNGQM
jgi:hypothetical protein